jgi:undecaprenyl diphosphate synthase
MPRHVAIIMDGNGRWATARGWPRNEGHRQGVGNVQRILDCARELGIRYLTLYAFSVENWQRPKPEIEALMALLERFLKVETRQLVAKQVRLRVLGRTDALPTHVRKLLDQALAATAACSEWNLSIALNYGSRQEIVDAVRAYTRAVLAGEADIDALDWPDLAARLYTADLPDPDLVIRTSGEYRVSNFLLLQSAYAEYFFAPQFWPDFTPDAFRAAIAAYRARERRFGMTGEQIHGGMTND